jgi:hypothetical protein
MQIVPSPMETACDKAMKAAEDLLQRLFRSARHIRINDDSAGALVGYRIGRDTRIVGFDAIPEARACNSARQR